MKVEYVYTPEAQELRGKILAQIDECRQMAFSCAVPMTAPRNIWPRLGVGCLSEADFIVDIAERDALFRAMIRPLVKALVDLGNMHIPTMICTAETEEEREWMRNRVDLP